MISLTQRFFCIAQLSLSFSLLLYLALQPFAINSYHLKQKETLYANIVGKSPSPSINEESSAFLDSSKFLFGKEPAYIQKQIHNHLEQVNLNSPNFKQMIQQSWNLFCKTSGWTRLWILLSLVIPFLILFQIKGAKKISPLLLLIGMASLFSPQSNQKPAFHEGELTPYLETPLTSNPLNQKKQLEKAYDRYLVHHHLGPDSPFDTPSIFNARYQELKKQFFEEKEPLQGISTQSIPFFSYLFIIWHLLFFFKIFFKKIKPTSKRQDHPRIQQEPAA